MKEERKEINKEGTKRGRNKTKVIRKECKKRK
jgi:hypothetical protein